MERDREGHRRVRYAFIFLISPDSSTSSVCGQEIDTAVKNAKRIIPLVVRETKEAPKQLSHLNWIFFRPNDDFDTAFKKLRTAIHTDYEWVQQHRWLQVRALDWERDNKDKGSLLHGKDLQDAELQLALNSSKEPHPTDLQREYVLESRKATESQKRIVIGITIAGLIALAFLAIWGWGQAALATNNASTAQAESTRAVSSFHTAQTAQMQAEQHRETAVANLNMANTAEAKSSRQAEIALSGS